mgnify:CR=1 FL=1
MTNVRFYAPTEAGRMRKCIQNCLRWIVHLRLVGIVVLCLATVSFCGAHAPSEGDLPGTQRFESACKVNEVGSILQNYITRHNNAVAFLRRQNGRNESVINVASDGEAKTLAEPKFLVWKCKSKKEIGGIGDRLKLFGILFYKAIATGRTLLIDFDDFSDIFEPNVLTEWRFSELEQDLIAWNPTWYQFMEDPEDDEVLPDGRTFRKFGSLPLPTEGSMGARAETYALEAEAVDVSEQVRVVHRMYVCMYGLSFRKS